MEALLFSSFSAKLKPSLLSRESEIEFLSCLIYLLLSKSLRTDSAEK